MHPSYHLLKFIAEGWAVRKPWDQNQYCFEERHHLQDLTYLDLPFSLESTEEEQK